MVRRAPPAALPDPIRAVTLELSQANVATFDVEATVSYFAERGFNTVVCFALGYLRGETYYPSAHAPPHPELAGRDLLGEVSSAAAEHDVAVIAYVNSLWAGPDVHEQHPEWLQRWSDGSESRQGEARAACPNSPYRQRIVAVASEIASGYPIAGLYLDEPSLQTWCACQYCRAFFQRDNGMELPLALEPGTPEFTAFLDWRADVVAGFVGEVGSGVRDVRSSCSFYAQHGFPLASTAQPHLRHLFWGHTSGRTPPQWEGWYRPTFYAQDIVKVGRALDLLSIEPWRRFVDQPAWWPGVGVSYARHAGGEKPVLPLMELPHFPWGLTPLSASELAANCADVVANGGDLWFPMYAPDAADRGGWEALRTVFAELEGVRPPGAVQIAPLAILASRLSAERFGGAHCEERYLDELLGMVQLVRELQIPYRILAEDALEHADLADVETVFLPGAAILRPQTGTRLKSYVAGGGGLIATGWTGTHGADGVPLEDGLLVDLLGASLGPDTVHGGIGYLTPTSAVSTDADTRLPVRDEQPAVKPLAAQVLYRLAPSWDLFAAPVAGETYPSLTLNQFGAGRAAYSGIGLGRLRRRFELFEATTLLERLLFHVHPTGFAIRGEQGRGEVGIYAWRSDQSVQIILVNYTSVEGSGSATELGETTVTVRASVARPSSVTSVRGTPVSVALEPGATAITLATLREWDCLVLL